MTNVRIELAQEREGIETWLIRLPRMPLPEKDRGPLAAFLRKLMHTASGQHHLTESVWIEATHIHHEGGSQLIAPNARTWAPKTGFGIHPDGELPRMWTEEDFSEAPFGHEPPVFNNQIFEVSRATGHDSALETMAGRGVLSLVLLQGSVEEFKTTTRAALGPLVTERAWQMYAYYFPLLRDTSAKQNEVASWMGNAIIYIREVFTDKMLLILSRVPLKRCLEEVGARHIGEGLWECQITGASAGE